MTTLAARVIVDRLREGAVTAWVLRGSSMWPAVRDGARVEVTPVDPRALRVGELIAFAREGGGPVVHRVTAVAAEGLRCRGDALAGDDGVVAWSDVLGRARVLGQRRLRVRWPRAGEVRALVRAAAGALRAGWA